MTRFSNMRRRIALVLSLITVAAGSQAPAQEAPVPIPVPAQDTTHKLLSPGGAFLRSVIIPGWGQASVGAYQRGGVFFAIQSASWYMLLKTLARLEDVHERETRSIAFISDTLRLRMAEDTTLARELEDPVKFMERVETDPNLIETRNLIATREQQRQDWITYTIFFTLASGMDAFIAAQLADFPATITTRPAPTGGMQLQVNVPFPRQP